MNGRLRRGRWAEKTDQPESTRLDRPFEIVLTMPPEIGEGGPLGLVPWQVDAGSLIVEQPLGPRVKAFLIEVAPGHDDPVVVAQGPQAVVEQPVGVLAQGQAVAWVVVA